jgi:phosphotransferase system enzyme I (PtsI)
MAEPLPAPSDAPSSLTADEERARVTAAVGAVARELEQRGAEAGGAAQDVLEAQAMMAEDPTLADEIASRLSDGRTGEWAVFDAFASFRDQLTALGGYLGERAADLDDVAQRVIARLRGVPAPGVPDPGHPYVLVAKDLAPADTALLDLTKVLALVTTEGGPTSHTAILAREKSIVAVVGTAAAKDLRDGEVVIVDAAAGVVTTQPTDEELERARNRAEARASATSAPITDGALSDGTPVPLLANLGNPDGALDAVALGAEGVGLFRTEFLFLSSSSAPTIDQQRESYAKLLSAFPGKKVVVRVLDAGADKPLPFLNDAHEENPALGLRGLRALRASEDILREQLTALAEANEATKHNESGPADLWVMAPMVATVEETEYFTAMCRDYGIHTAGVMVEVPSSALLADRILESADFASIGTNDLTQYTLAADRLLGSVASFQDPWHPAVLRLIREVGDAGRVHGKPVGICGEAAADPLLAIVLVGLGATSLSMAPTALADVRASLLQHSLDDARVIAGAALAASDAASAREAARAAASQHSTVAAH